MFFKMCYICSMSFDCQTNICKTSIDFFSYILSIPILEHRENFGRAAILFGLKYLGLLIWFPRLLFVLQNIDKGHMWTNKGYK